MLGSRQGMLIVAVVAAAIAAAVIVIAINRYRDSVNSSNAEVTVLVANNLIQKGTSGQTLATSGLYTPTKVIQKHVTTGAITDAAGLQGKVAVTDILPGQQLTLSDFAVGTGIITELASNERAISIPLDSSHGLSGIVTPGDRVDVYSGFNVQTSGGTGPQMRLLVPDVQVLSTSGGGQGSSGNVVLAVNDNYAAEVAYASDNGKVWLVLRPGNAQNASQTIATINSILAARPPIATNNGRKP